MAKASSKDKAPKLNGKSYDGIPLVRPGKDIVAPTVTAPQVSVDPLAPTDTTINYDQVTADKLENRFMTAADYAFVDPAQISKEFGDLGREQFSKNIGLSSQAALDALRTELQGLQFFAPAAAALQRGEVAKDNRFNQAEREAQIASVDPSLKADLMGQAARARGYAEGIIPDKIQDRGYELGLRSRAADAAASGGFGVRSSAARKVSDLMSAESRIQLSQYGDQLLTSNLEARNKLLFAPLQQATGGASINVNPSASVSANQTNILNALNDKTIISSEAALTNKTQQEQFKTNLEQEARKTNVTLASQRDIEQARLNQQAQITNTSNAIDVQKFGIDVRSREAQFNKNMEFNVKNTNADRQFQADNSNAGRALEVAISNRNTRIEVQKGNQSIIAQDIMQRRSEAAANARAAMAERGAMARAQLSADLQREALASQEKLAREGFDKYQEGIKAGNKAQDTATAGQVISRAPSIIAGINGLINTFGGDSNNTSTGDYFNYDSGYNNSGSGSSGDFYYNPDSGSGIPHIGDDNSVTWQNA